MRVEHAWRAWHGIVRREAGKFARQRARLLAALVRPLLWLAVFGAGLRGIVDLGVVAPYGGAVDYPVYVVPGLLGMILLFNGMQSSLAMVYDREMGLMRLLLTAPLPRGWLLFAKLSAGTAVSLVQAYVFLAIAAAFGPRFPWTAWLQVLPALLGVGMMLGALGLLLSVYVRQIENFAGVMNFVIFPLFFLSSALYPLASLEQGSRVLAALAGLNPFNHGVELIRFALYGQLNAAAAAVVAGAAALCFALAVRGYSPERGLPGTREPG